VATSLKGKNMSEDRKMIDAQNKRIALLEDAMENLHMEIALIHEVTGSIINATGCMPAVAGNDKLRFMTKTK